MYKNDALELNLKALIEQYPNKKITDKLPSNLLTKTNRVANMNNLTLAHYLTELGFEHPFKATKEDVLKSVEKKFKDKKISKLFIKHRNLFKLIREVAHCEKKGWKTFLEENGFEVLDEDVINNDLLHEYLSFYFSNGKLPNLRQADLGLYTWIKENFSHDLSVGYYLEKKGYHFNYKTLKNDFDVIDMIKEVHPNKKISKFDLLDENLKTIITSRARIAELSNDDYLKKLGFDVIESTSKNNNINIFKVTIEEFRQSIIERYPQFYCC